MQGTARSTLHRRKRAAYGSRMKSARRSNGMKRPRKRKRPYARAGRKSAKGAGFPQADHNPAAAADPAPDETHMAAYNRGYDEGYDTGFDKGRYAGGEGLVDRLMPGGFVLPLVPVEHIVAAGLEQFRDRMWPVMGSAEVADFLTDALDRRRPASVIRLGDGELLTMAQESVYPVEYIRKHAPFLSYAGVELPDPDAREMLVTAVRQADIVGIPLLRVPHFQHLAFQLFELYGIDYKAKRLTHSTINYAMYLEHALGSVMKGRKVLTVGNRAGELAIYLGERGVQVTGAVAPVQGMRDIPRVMQSVAAHDFDLALVSAGIAAVVLVWRIAAELGKAAFDFGHLADSMISGDAPLDPIGTV